MCDVNYLKNHCNEIIDVFWENSEVVVILESVTDQAEDSLYGMAPHLPLHLISEAVYKETKNGIREISKTIIGSNSNCNSCIC